MSTSSIAAAAAFLLAVTACASGTDTADEGAASSGSSVSFALPADGETVSSPVAVQMTATDFTIEEAGEVTDGAGHFHIMVDTDCVAEGQIVPNDETHLHYGKAQTEAELDLTPGQHQLCLQAGDGAHTALALTETITITVE